MSHIIQKIVLPLLILSLGIGGLLVMRLLLDSDEVGVAPATTIATVDVLRSAPYANHFGMETDGTVVPLRDIIVAAEIPGRVSIKSKECNEGNFVRKDTHLFTIDKRDYELLSRQLKEQVRQAEADLHLLEVDRTGTEKLVELSEQQLVLQQNEVTRTTKLVAREAATESDLDREKRAELVIQNQLLSLRKESQLLNTRYAKQQSIVALARIQLEQADLDLRRTEVLAPIDGVIVSDLVEQDSYVQRGASMVTIDDTSAVEITCNLRMKELYWVWNQERAVPPRSTEADVHEVDSHEEVGKRYQIPKTTATVVYRFAGADTVKYLWRGELDRYDGVGLDERTRTVPCRVLVPHPRDVRAWPANKPVPSDPEKWQATSANQPGGATSLPSLMRGMFVTVWLDIVPSASKRMFQVPEEAVQADKTIRVVGHDPENDTHFLREVRGAKLVQQQEVRDAKGIARRFWLIDASDTSLRAGDRVITTPLGVVTRRMQIKLPSPSEEEEN